jgi:hypothetical protein
VAAEILDPISTRAMLDIAESYEQLARRAAQRGDGSPAPPRTDLSPGASAPQVT